MKKKSEKQISAGVAVCSIASMALILLSACLAGCWYYFKYLPLLLMAFIMLMPALINLLLLLPDGKKYVKTPAAPKPPKVRGERRSFKELVRKIFSKLRSAWRKFTKFLSVNRTRIAVTFSVLTVAVICVLFFMSARLGTEHSFGFVLPVILCALFVLLIVIDKWLAYSSADFKNSREAVIAGNLHSVIVMSMAVTVITLVITTLCVLKIFELQSLLVIILSVVFVYETLFVALSLAVRMIRNELYTEPEVVIPLPGSKNDSLNVLSYLEKNTGITMRSLWSIMLIKKIIPFAFAFSALVLWLSTGIVQIESYQQGALYRLGTLKSDSMSPGIHITMPWPIDKVEIYDTETVNEITVGYLATDATDNLWTEAHGNNEYKLLLGGGNELVSINLRIEYKIGDLGKFLKCSTSPAKLLESTAYETVTGKTINTDLDTLLATDRAEFSKSFEKELTERIAKYNTGLEIVNVVIESIHPPVEVAQIYQQIISAGIEAEKIILDAQAQAEVTLSEAQEQYDKDVNAANADSYKLKAEAEASVAEFSASVENDKNYGDGYRYYKYLEAIQNAYSGAKLIIVGDGIDSSSLYLGSVS